MKIWNVYKISSKPNLNYIFTSAQIPLHFILLLVLLKSFWYRNDIISIYNLHDIFVKYISESFKWLKQCLSKMSDIDCIWTKIYSYNPKVLLSNYFRIIAIDFNTKRWFQLYHKCEERLLKVCILSPENDNKKNVFIYLNDKRTLNI